MPDNFDRIMDLIGQAEKLMEKVDSSFQTMSRGGVIDTSRGTVGLMHNLRKANAIYKKLDKLTKEGGDSYTEEEKKIIEEKARELTAKYNLYLKLVEDANNVYKNFLKETGKSVVDTAKGMINDIVGKNKDADADKEEPAGGIQ